MSAAEEQVQKIFTWRAFDKTQGDEPLARCREWAVDNCIQTDKAHLTPMVVVAVEIGAGNREYRAATYAALLALAKSFGRNHDTDRHMQEVVVMGPCKLYCDLECKFANEAEHNARRDALNASAAQFIGDVVAYAKDKYNATLEPLVLVSHGAKKWSKHVIFDGPVWRNNVHACAFMRDVVRQSIGANPTLAEYFDPDVYTPNRCFRMYRCTKWDDPTRTLSLENSQNSAPEAIDEEIWLKSLITCVQLKREGNAEPLYVSSTFLELYYDSFWPKNRDIASHLIREPLKHEDVDRLGLYGVANELRVLLGKRAPPNAAAAGLKSSTGLRVSLANLFASNGGAGAYGGTDMDEGQFRAVMAREKHALVSRFHRFKAVGVTCRDVSSSVLRIECRSKYCELAQRDHSGNHVYINVDFLSLRWRQLCYDSECMAVDLSLKQWQPFDSAEDDEIVRACQALCEAWPYKRKVPHLVSFLANSRHCFPRPGGVAQGQ